MSDEIKQLKSENYFIENFKYGYSYLNTIKHKKKNLMAFIQFCHHGFGYEGIHFHRNIRD